jgi:hypothetical protein
MKDSSPSTNACILNQLNLVHILKISSPKTQFKTLFACYMSCPFPSPSFNHPTTPMKKKFEVSH